MHVRDADEIEISRNRVLQASSGQTEVDARLVVETCLETVEHTGRESIAATDAAFSNATRLTLVGSITLALSKFS